MGQISCACSLQSVKSHPAQENTYVVCFVSPKNDIQNRFYSADEAAFSWKEARKACLAVTTEVYHYQRLYLAFHTT